MAQSAGSKINGLFDGGVLQAFGMAMGTYFGQNYGAKRTDRIREGVKVGFIIGTIVAIYSAVLGVIIVYPMSWLLLPNVSSEIYRLVFIYNIIHGANYIFLMLVFFFRHALQGVGKSITAALGGVVELIARVACSFTLARVSFEFACLSNPSAWLTAGVFLMVAFLIYLKNIDDKIQ